MSQNPELESAIDSLADGDTNGFVGKVNDEILKRAQDSIQNRKVVLAQSLFDDDDDEEEVDDWDENEEEEAGDEDANDGENEDENV